MSIKVLKSGLWSTFQDLGRYGYRHLGINTNGVMDSYNFFLLNSLLNNPKNTPALECFFPAVSLQFTTDLTMAIIGADFSPHLNNYPIKNGLVKVTKNDILEFKYPRIGKIVYIGMKGAFDLDFYLDSYSTNIIGNFGGYKGRQLKNGDELFWSKEATIHYKAMDTDQSKIPMVQIPEPHQEVILKLFKGPDIKWLENIEDLLSSIFFIQSQSNRMGYYLNAEKKLQFALKDEYISTPVIPGTIQLLPSGNLCVLMKDAQTTGGYPRIGYISSDDFSLFSQLSFKNPIRFKFYEYY